jgi:hypothetical protein
LLNGNTIAWLLRANIWANLWLEQRVCSLDISIWLILLWLKVLKWIWLVWLIWLIWILLSMWANLWLMIHFLRRRILVKGIWLLFLWSYWLKIWILELSLILLILAHPHWVIVWVRTDDITDRINALKVLPDIIITLHLWLINLLLLLKLLVILILIHWENIGTLIWNLRHLLTIGSLRLWISMALYCLWVKALLKMGSHMMNNILIRNRWSLNLIDLGSWIDKLIIERLLLNLSILKVSLLLCYLWLVLVYVNEIVWNLTRRVLLLRTITIRLLLHIN